jgi:hypothetical protein
MWIQARCGDRVLWLPLLAAALLAGCGGGDMPAGAASTATANTPPVITGTPDATVVAEQPYSFTPEVSDAGHDELGFAVTNKPAWATFSTVTGALTGTPLNPTWATTRVLRSASAMASTPRR